MLDRKKLLNYTKDDKKVLSIQEHYERVLAPLGGKYTHYSFSTSSTVVCPFHQDNDPSFGVIKGRDGVDRYHCFGCGVVGDFLDFYREVERIYHNRNLSKDLVVQEVLTSYNIPLAEVETTLEEKELGREEAMEGLRTKYTVADFERDVRKGILLEHPIPYFNLKLVELLSSQL